VTDAVRTADELLEGLPEFPFRSSYRDHDGLRLAHLDEGGGRPVVFFHGEPTWSFLWRKVIPAVRDAGHRCIAPDLPGFGRSDKRIATRPSSCTTGVARSACGWRLSSPSGSPAWWCSIRACSRAISR
jgi:pimeloyl-ACP methyl ester carboxylesterase